MPGETKTRAPTVPESSTISPKTSTAKMISYEELSKHNTINDCWIAVREKVYNVTSWIPDHPGGSDFIVFNGGRDATQLFEAYHPVRVYGRLTKHYVGELEPSSTHPRFPPMSEFYKTLKVKIENYFLERKMSPRSGNEMLARTAVLISMSFAFHYLSVVSSNLWISLACAAMAGFIYALLSFMPVHEGSHAATTDSPIMWRLLGSVHDYVNGASYYTWCHQHFLGHHPFTNVTNGEEANDAYDPDIVTGDPDIRRIKPTQRVMNHYRFQQFYAPLLYGLLGVKYRINDFLVMFVYKTNGYVTLTPPNAYHLFTFFAGKAFFVLYRFIIPSFYIPIWKVFLLFAVADAFTSYVLAFVFQVNHVVPQTSWPTTDKTGFVNMDWAEMQVVTTMDYAHGSWWSTFLSGALNYQVTHHLFPYICQLHYPAIAPIILDHCKQYNIKYTVLPTFWDALKAHFEYLRIMGHGHTDF